MDVTGGVRVGSTRVKALCNSMLKKRKKGERNKEETSIRPNTIHSTKKKINKIKKKEKDLAMES